MVAEHADCVDLFSPWALFFETFPCVKEDRMKVDTMVRNCGTEQSPQVLGDDVLVLAAQAGDEGAFSELWRRHSPMILRVLLKITRNREDAEDALQDTFLSAFAHLSKFEARAKFSTWLARIAFNSGLMILRRRRNRNAISIDSQFAGETRKPCDLADQRMDTENSFIRTECGASIESALTLLRPTLSVIIQHQLLHDCSVAETARSHGLTLGATKSRLMRARRALRESLACKINRR
jgi:RNA polymerase sigma factor (sigma-70 family)